MKLFIFTVLCLVIASAMGELSWGEKLDICKSGCDNIAFGSACSSVPSFCKTRAAASCKNFCNTEYGPSA